MLDSLAQGLRAAGGILSPGVSKQLDDERELAMRQEQAKKSMIAQRIIAGVEQGAINPELARTQLAQLGFGDFPQGALGPTPEAQTRMQALERQKRKEAFLATPEVQARIEQGDDLGVARLLYGRGMITAEEFQKAVGEARKANEPKGFAPGSVIYRGDQQVGTVPREQFSEPYVNESGQRVQKGPDNRVHVLQQAQNDWSEPYDGPRGTKLQRNNRTGEIRQVVSQAPATIINPQPTAPVQIADSTSPTGTKWVSREDALGQPAPRPQSNPQNLTLKLRNDFTKDEAVKRYEQMSPVWSTSLSYMSELSKGGKPNPPADRALIRSFLKITDPAGQIAVADERNAQKFAGLPDRVIQGIVNTFEGQMLPDSVRADLFKELKRRWDELGNRRNVRAQDFRTLAEEFGIDPNQVVRPDPERAPAAPGQRTFRVLGPEK